MVFTRQVAKTESPSRVLVAVASHSGGVSPQVYRGLLCLQENVGYSLYVQTAFFRIISNTLLTTSLSFVPI
jgi:hypothetical protein